MNADARYDALLTRDKRFDGVFFVAVSTTGIYCRPICPARTPGRTRCTFYDTAAQAEAAGPFTSLNIVNSTLSYRLRAHGRMNARLTLDTGIDLLSRATRYEALVPIDDNLINSQGIDVDPSQLFRGATTIGLDHSPDTTSASRDSKLPE